MNYALRAKRVYTEDKVLENAVILIEDGSIKEILEDSNREIEVLYDMEEFNVLPGLVDLHIHGGSGCDTMDASFEAINEISKYLASRGVTSFLPTTVTDSIDRIKAAVANVKEVMGKVEGAEIIGSYVEGPYITSEHKGAHPEKLIRELGIEEIDEIIEASGNTVKVVTIAPEKKNAEEVIRHLTEKGVHVSLGHTSATYDEANRAICCGAKIAVHTYNGMRGFNHREPGIVGAVLTNDEVYCELISDMIHVHPVAIDVLLRCKGNDKVVLISDCMRAGGLKDGEYMLGTLKVIVKDSIARVESGNLAGSTTNIMDCVKNLIRELKLHPSTAIRMASLNPSRLMGIDDTVGSIKAGKKANLTVVDDDFNVVMTIVNGKVVYKR